MLNRTSSVLEVGNIYDVVGGYFETRQCGRTRKFPGSRPIGSFEDLQEYLKGLGDRTSERDMYFTSETVKIAEIAE